MTTADAYNKLLPLYNKELDATETIVYSIGSVSYIAVGKEYVGGADSKLAIELTKCDRTGYLRKRDTAGQAGETMENQRRGAGNG